MNKDHLSRDTAKELDRLVERVARKTGYSATEETYKESLTRKFDELKEGWKKEAKKYRHKFSMKSSTNPDFAEEIKAYLSDGIADLKAEGYSEEEALRITMEKFDEAELQESFEDFMKEMDDFGMEEYIMNSQQWYAENGETIGLFYGGFTVLGMTLGALIGFLISGGVPEFLGYGWIYTLIGLVVGTMLGAGCGLISHAIIAAKKK